MAVAVLLSACTVPAMTIETYADALTEATESYVGESQALSAAFHKTVEDQVSDLVDAGDPDPLAIATAITAREMTQYLVLLEDAMTRYGAALDEMHPPANLIELHDDYVAAIASIRIALPLTRDAVTDAPTLDRIQEAITSSGFADGQIRLQSSCSALQDAVRSGGRGVELGCTRPITET